MQRQVRDRHLSPRLCVSGKMGFSNQPDALQRVRYERKVFGGGTKRIYWCGLCGRWHLTKRKGG